MMMAGWDVLADDSSLEKTVGALTANGIEVYVVNDRKEALSKIIYLIPQGSEVMEGSSTSMNEIGATKEIEESGKYRALRKEIQAISDPLKREEARKRASAPAYGMGSVHAITQDGKLVVASATGSQLGIYVYGAANLVLVAGTQKIVKDVDAAFARIREYIFPLEDARMKKAYGVGSRINKMLIINKENPGRIKLILVKEKLGF
jgi:hypothetical protein